MGELRKKVGKRIKEIRESLNIKQFELADMLDMEPSNLTRIESGYQFPKEENISKIASKLGVEEKDLFELVRLAEIDAINANFSNIKRVKIVAADGATNYMRECIDDMDDATFEIWMKYHLSICERMDLIGATNHSLDILRKD